MKTFFMSTLPSTRDESSECSSLEYAGNRDIICTTFLSTKMEKTTSNAVLLITLLLVLGLLPRLFTSFKGFAPVSYHKYRNL